MHVRAKTNPNANNASASASANANASANNANAIDRHRHHFSHHQSSQYTYSFMASGWAAVPLAHLRWASAPLFLVKIVVQAIQYKGIIVLK